MMPRYFKFIASRLIGTIVDTLVIWLLTNFIFSSYLGVYIIAPTISFEFAVLSNFLFSYFWIWSNRVAVKNYRSFFNHFLSFNISSFFGFVVKMGFLLLFSKMLNWSVVYCNFLALLISGVVNFGLSELVVFKKSPVMDSVDEKILVRGNKSSKV